MASSLELLSGMLPTHTAVGLSPKPDSPAAAISSLRCSQSELEAPSRPVTESLEMVMQLSWLSLLPIGVGE